MTDDAGLTQQVAMHAILRKADARANAKGDRKYKLAFSYPRGYLVALDELLGEKVDVFWNENLVARSAEIVKMHQTPVKDADPDYIVDMDANPDDAALANLAEQSNDAGDLRLVQTQLSLLGKA